jgi:hypothetical protein
VNAPRDAFGRIDVALQELHKRRVDQRYQRERTVVFGLVAILERGRKPLERTDGLRTDEQRANGIQPFTFIRSRIQPHRATTSSDLEPTLADNDGYDVLPLCEP